MKLCRDAAGLVQVSLTGSILHVLLECLDKYDREIGKQMFKKIMNGLTTGE